MKKIYLFIIFFTSAFPFYAQSCDWVKPINYIDSNLSSTSALTKSITDNLLTRYLSGPYTSVQTDLIFCNSNGDTLWKKTFPNLKIEDTFIDSVIIYILQAASSTR